MPNQDSLDNKINSLFSEITPPAAEPMSSTPIKSILTPASNYYNIEPQGPYTALPYTVETSEASTLKDYLEIFGRRRWVVLLTTLFAFAIASIGAWTVPPKYTARAVIRVLTARTGGTTYTDYNVEYAERLVATYVKMSLSTPILTELSRSVNIPVDELLPMIKVDILASTELFQIEFTSEDPALAQFAANKLAQLVVEESKKLSTNEGTPTSIYIADPAPLPDAPSSPSPWLISALGLVVGLVGGIGLAILFESVDTRLYTTRAIEALLGVKALGDIPDERGYDEESGEMLIDTKLQQEAFRRLRTAIFSPGSSGKLRSLLITSAVSQDGKSSITTNLALSIAQTRRNVIIVDANLRWPKIHKLLKVNNEKGLSDLLNQDLLPLDLSPYIKQTKYERLYVLPSGTPTSTPAELLGTKNMEDLIVELKKIFNVVIIDSPSCLSVADAVLLAPMVDGVLLVVRKGWVRKEVLTNTYRQLSMANATLIGFVINRTEVGSGSRYAKSKAVEVPKPTIMALRQTPEVDVQKLKEIQSELEQILSHVQK